MIGTRLGRYVVDEWIGQGGMASVWRMTDDQGQLWALKVLSVKKQEVKDRFLSEARVQLTLSHPNVVAAREVLELDGEPALVMEYVPGVSLDQYLADRDPPFEVRDALARQLLEGVAYAHACNLVHRDLKPANVLVVETPAGPIPRLTDFGLVKELGFGATRTGIALGTPRYMAPEQIRDAKRVDPRADIWSLGTLLYEVYTDRSPFQRDTLYETFQAVMDGTYQDPGDYGVPARVQTAIVACLHLDPDARPQSVPALQALLAGEPTPVPTHRSKARASSSPPLAEPTFYELSGPHPTLPLAGERPRAHPSRPSAWLVTWVAGWTLALLLVLAVLAGGVVVVTAVVVSGVVWDRDVPPPPPALPPPARKRRR